MQPRTISAVGFFLLWCQPETCNLRAQESGTPVRVHAEAPWPAADPRVQSTFGVFTEQYTAALREQLGAAHHGWEFWLILEEEPYRGARPHILIGATKESLRVPIMRLSVKRSPRHVSRAVQRSVQLANDAFLNQITNGGDTALSGTPRVHYSGTVNHH